MRFRSYLLLFPLFFLISCETVEKTKPTAISSRTKLESKPQGIGNQVLIKEADPEKLKRYKRVIIEDVRVKIPKSTNPKVRRATKKEAEQLAEQFEDILEKELEKKYEITRYRSYSTMAVRASLTEIRPSNPALFAVNYVPYASYAATGIRLATGETIGAGSTTVEIEVVDSRSRRQLFALVDQLKGGKYQPGSFEKFGQSKGAMRGWARQVRRGIQGAKPSPWGNASAE